MTMTRRIVFRIFVGLLLALSPVVFPAVLMVVGEGITLSNLRKFYSETWRFFVRGFA